MSEARTWPRLSIKARAVTRADPLAAGQDRIFDTYRHQGYVTTVDASVLDTAVADRVHCGHAIIEQVNVELKAGPLTQMPSGGQPPQPDRRTPPANCWRARGVVSVGPSRR